jgi:Polysaccharide pyruvyl transferase
MRVLLTGWFSFRHGEATAGDVLAAQAVADALDAAGVAYDIAWSPVFRPGALELSRAAPERYTHLVFACGPVHGNQIAGLHTRYRSCRRIAVGVSVVDENDPACTGFDVLLPRDGPGRAPVRDLASATVPERADRGTLPVTGVFLTTGQGEYGQRRHHDLVTAGLTAWLNIKRCAPVPLDTRLDSRDWRLCSSPEMLTTLISRLDIVVTMRLHGLVLALRAGVPALAIDPVTGGGKVTAQAAAWDWPAVLAAEQVADQSLLDERWDWCRSPAGRSEALRAAAHGIEQPQALLAALVRVLHSGR